MILFCQTATGRGKASVKTGGNKDCDGEQTEADETSEEEGIIAGDQVQKQRSGKVRRHHVPAVER